MAGGPIKGITIEFRGETTQLSKALRTVDNEARATTKGLRDINRALKFNPTNLELWKQKQSMLNIQIKETEEKLKLLQDTQKKLDDDPTVDKESKEYMELRREIIETESKLKHFQSELRKVGNVKLKALGEQFKRVGQKMTTIGKDMTTKITAPIAAVSAVAIKKFADVDKTMQLTNSTMGNTAKEANLLNKAMKSAAASSTYGMNDAATATLNFARAGLSAQQAADALAPAMALAAGEGGELDTVSSGLVATINGFHDGFDQASQYADVFANACNNSALDVNSLSEAMSVAAPVFASAGYNVQDAALYMGVMANNGIDANKAANSLKTGLSRLVSPAKDGAAMMEKLGISVTNSDGSLKDSVQIQAELSAAFGKLSESEQIAAASAIFGKNQMAPWLALINTAPGEVAKLNTALGESGTAMEMQASMMSGFGGSLEQLKSGLDVLATSFGEALAPTIQKVVGWLQTLIDWFNGLSPQAQTTIATIAMIVAALGPVLVILGTLASAIGSIMTLVAGAGPVIAALTGPVGIAIAIIAGLIVLGVKLYKNWDTVKAKAAAFKAALISQFNALKASITATFNAIKNAIIRPIQSAIDKVKAIINKLKGIFPIKVGKIFSGIQLPHFKLTGSFSLKKMTVPHLSVSWYKQGGIFDSPTIAGLGEAGPEAVVPLDKLWSKFDEMTAAMSRVSASGVGTIEIPIYLYPSGPEMGRHVVKTYDKWKKRV